MGTPDAPRYVVIADPQSLRWTHYQRDLLAYWRSRGLEPDVQVVRWRDLIARDGDLGDLVASESPAWLRIESPARDFAVTRALLQAGQRDIGETESEWSHPAGELGWLASPSLVQRGLSRTLRGLARSVEALPWLTPTADVEDILALFDKNATSQRLRTAGLPTPDWFEAPASPDALVQDVQARGWPWAYVKLNQGSCASGIVVLRRCREGELSYKTTLMERAGSFFNVRPAVLWQRADPKALSPLLGFLHTHGATVQRGVPKLNLGGEHFDVRVVVVGSRVAATVFRCSPHPMTNLHLGGRRGDPEACRRLIPRRRWLDATDHCVQAASLYRLPAVGMDVAFDARTLEPQILEVNAFGDFLPNWRDEVGRTVHQQEIAETARVPAHAMAN